MDARADLFLRKGTYENAGEQHPAAKGGQAPVSGAIHAEIAALAAHIQQLREQLMTQPEDLEIISQPAPGEECGEEEAFPTWLN